jgi:hypothetical protein
MALVGLGHPFTTVALPLIIADQKVQRRIPFPIG